MDTNTIIYIVVFIVVLVPSLLTSMLSSAKEVAGADENKAMSSQKDGAPLFRILGTPIKIIDSLGFGALIAAMRPQRTAFLEGRITIANLNMRPQTIYSAQLLLAPLGGIIGFLLFVSLPIERQWSMLALIIGLWMGWVYPAVAIEEVADKRQTEIVRGLPFAIDLISSAMRSGLDFGAAVRYYVSLGIETPLTVEFGIMLRQIELGKTRIEALTAMAKRINTKEFTSFVAAVVHGTQIGASIVDTMNIQGEEMRRARFHLAERKAARAPSLMILPMALFIMPSVFIMIFTPVYIKVQASGMGGFFRH